MNQESNEKALHSEQVTKEDEKSDKQDQKIQVQAEEINENKKSKDHGCCGGCGGQ